MVSIIGITAGFKVDVVAAGRAENPEESGVGGVCKLVAEAKFYPVVTWQGFHDVVSAAEIQLESLAFATQRKGRAAEIGRDH
ncbi:MAG: hypothetical protein BWX83_01201 [Candidatus Cloacimonetes bacterium ADurb.Bin117]|nr:MAG: hypothetical protein BWX83_01201 [Candidatus Cloacimonetes bacterium ADurb.Bin117]